ATVLAQSRRSARLLPPEPAGGGDGTVPGHAREASDRTRSVGELLPAPARLALDRSADTAAAGQLAPGRRALVALAPGRTGRARCRPVDRPGVSRSQGRGRPHFRPGA